jgi:hypothetical protein
MPAVRGIGGSSRSMAFEGIGTALFLPDRPDRALHRSWNDTPAAESWVRNRISVNEKAAFAGEVTKPREQDNVVNEAMPADGVRWRRSDMEMDVKQVIRTAHRGDRPPKILHRVT